MYEDMTEILDSYVSFHNEYWHVEEQHEKWYNQFRTILKQVSMAILYQHLQMDTSVVADDVNDVKVPASFNYDTYKQDVTDLWDMYKHALKKHVNREKKVEVTSCEKQLTGHDCAAFVNILKDPNAYTARRSVSTSLIFSLIEDNDMASQRSMDEVVRFIQRIETMALEEPVLKNLVYSEDMQAQQGETVQEILEYRLL